MNLVAGVAAVLMILVGGYAIAAIWWDDSELRSSSSGVGSRACVSATSSFGSPISGSR